MPQRGDSWADQEAAFFGTAATTGGENDAPTNKRLAPLSAGGISSSSSSSSVPIPPEVRERATALRDSVRDAAVSAGRTLRRELDDAWRQRRDEVPGSGVGGSHHWSSSYPAQRRGGGDGGSYGGDEANSTSRVGDGYADPSRPAAALASSFPRPAHPPPPSSSAQPQPQSISSSVASLSRRLTNSLSTYVPTCVVCGTLAPTRYQYHPFFPHEKACASHNNVGKCCGCNRFEPQPGSTVAEKQFVDLQDCDRKLCPACLRTVVTDSNEGRELWAEVLQFLRSRHGLLDGHDDCDCAVGRTMENIPVLIVEHDALNDPGVRGSGHGAGHTRGLCVYEYTTHQLGGQLREFLNVSGMAALVGDGVAGALKSKARVTAVLCLRGLPRDLVASVLAHEATHAWFKLHESFDPHRGGGGLPKMVEEGCCQLVAYLYLRHLEEQQDGDDVGSTSMRGQHNGVGQHLEEDGGPSDAKLRQYFRYSIETMTDDVYGEGFRRAAEAYSGAAGESLRALLEYVAENGNFPPTVAGH